MHTYNINLQVMLRSIFLSFWCPWMDWIQIDRALRYASVILDRGEKCFQPTAMYSSHLEGIFQFPFTFTSGIHPYKFGLWWVFLYLFRVHTEALYSSFLEAFSGRKEVATHVCCLLPREPHSPSSSMLTATHLGKMDHTVFHVLWWNPSDPCQLNASWPCS